MKSVQSLPVLVVCSIVLHGDVPRISTKLSLHIELHVLDSQSKTLTKIIPECLFFPLLEIITGPVETHG